MFLLLLPLTAFAQVLEVRLEGLDGELEKNARAWLGDAPTTPQSRSNYLHGARERVVSSLQALGYYRAEVDLQLERGEPWVLSIHVDPGEPVRLRHVNIGLDGEAKNDPAFSDLLADSGLKRDDVLNHGTYEDFRRKLQSLALQRGYFDGRFSQARVEVEPIGGTADVHLHYNSGPRYRFGPLQWDRETIDGSLVRPLLTAREGEPYDQAKLRESQIQLQRTGYFSTVILRPDLDDRGDAVVPLDLELFPATRHSFDVGVGYSTDTEERVTLTWRTPRLNRYGHSQETRLQYSSVNPSGRFTYSIPMSHPLNDVLQFSALVEDNEFGDLDSRQQELRVRREFRRNSWIYSFSLRGLRESWNAAGNSFEAEYLLPGFSLSQRKRGGSLVNPSSGFSQWYRIEGGSESAGSHIDLLRLSANYGYIHSFGERHRVVLRSDLGTVLVPDGQRDSLAPSLNFFAGGAQSIRGYGYQSIGREIVTTNDQGEEVKLVVGGERLVTGSAEYQYSFTPQWRGALFLDGGDAFDKDDFDMHYGAGVGVHYVTQVGAIRLELANPFSEDDPSWRIHLAIGAEF
ncbi:autotransporter assembly complex protein TamA [Mangrovimicrobium sediminis]|uniref:autotransporter assembly complex protein TamA n=1 Tax=Mangrovimicrobium sediminis TaxID=2562682 RepID=UPI001436B432|nr:autotransporter assembly complex family protein [Haliea sp. SAOS-164]